MTSDQRDEEHLGTTPAPTRALTRAFGLPSSWAAWADRQRIIPKDSTEQRRMVMLESVALCAVIGCFIAGVVTLAVNPGRGITWLLAGVCAAGVYVLALRGYADTVLKVCLPGIIALMGVLSYLHQINVAASACGMLCALIMSALAESRWRTISLGLFSVLTSVVGSIVTHEPVADALNTALLILLASGIATIGSVLWESAHTELENRVAERTRDLQELSIRDDLTGLYNRRHFMAHLQEPLAPAEQRSLLMIDVDHFKQINDTCGHTVGDEVLTTIAATMQGYVRPNDVLARVGGEEFALLLPGVPLADAELLAERLRLGVQDLLWPADLHVPGGRTTVSVGCASIGAESLLDLMRRADQALYASKAQGHNRTTLANAATVELPDTGLNQSRTTQLD